MTTQSKRRIERRDAGSLISGQRYKWLNRWRIYGVIGGGRVISRFLKPNKPSGKPVRGRYHSPPRTPTEVDVRVMPERGFFG